MKQATQLLSLAFLLSAGIMTTACSNDDNGIDEAPAKKTYYVSIDASKGSTVNAARATRALSFDETTITATWSTTDKIYVKYGKTWLEGSLSPNANAVGARLTGTIITTTDYFNLDDRITILLWYPRKPEEGVDSYAGQIGTLEDIAQKYDYAAATKSVTVRDNYIEGGETAYFENQQAIVKFTLVDKGKLVDKGNSDARIKPTDFTITIKNDPSDDYDKISLTDIPEATYTTNGAGVLYVAIPGFTDKRVELSATVGGATYTYSTKTGVTFVNGSYYPITVKMTKP